MTEPDDIELLRQYAGENSEAAFAVLAGRHVNLVYSVALRHVGNPHAAEEITQAVFIILSRKAKSFSRKIILTGWLHQTTRLTAANFLRTEIRRQNREQEAYMQSALSETETWTQIAPLLDDAISKLGERDRNAILLRYFENKSAREMSAALRVDEPAAQKRVTRAVEKLRAFFAKRGVTLTATAIAGAVSANSVQAAPVGLAAAVTAAAAKGAAVSASTLTLIKGALKIMAWTKMQMGIITTAVVILAAGTATVTVKEIQKHEDENFQWQALENLSLIWLEKAPPLLKIVPSKFPNDASGIGIGNSNGWKAVRLGQTVKHMVEDAYGFHDSRTIFTMPLPEDKYDYIVTVPSKARQSLQNEIKKQVGITGQFELLETNVLFLTVKNPNANGLKPNTSGKIFEWNDPGLLSGTNKTLSRLAEMLEGLFGIPVVDQTGLSNRYDFELTWDRYGQKIGNSYPDYPNLKGLKHALLDQLGLELVPTNMPIEMLVVEKVKN